MTTRHRYWAAIAAIAAVGLLAIALASNGAPGAPRFEALVAEAQKRTRAISVPTLRARIDAGERDFALIDVREDAEWAAGGLPGAIHIARGVLERDIEKALPDLRAEIVLYCAAGARSTLAAESLQRMGYTNVYSLDGGARAWFASSPVVRRQETP